MVAGRGRGVARAGFAVALCALVVGASPQLVNAGRESSIVLSGYETGVTIVSSSDSSAQSIRVDFGPDRPPLPNKFVIDIPAGYTLDLSASPETRVGDAAVAIFGVDAPSFASSFGPLVAKDPKDFLSDPAAQACAPGLHKAAWAFTTSLAGQRVDVNVFVDAGTEAGVAYVLLGCPAGLTGANADSAASISLAGIPLTSPTSPGVYRWRALVTPQNRKGYELQAVVPLPESVTLDARYDRKHMTAILTGTVVEGGEAVDGVRLVLQSSRNDDDLDLWDARTDAHGRFSLRTRITRTTDFTVTVAPSIGPCAGTSTMPGGCLASTRVPPDDAFATVWVSVRGGAVRAIRAADQRQADREGLAGADLPAGLESTLAGGDDCLNPKHESALTITGESTSPLFYEIDVSEPSITEAMGLTRIYATTAQARRAFEHQARASTARCEVARTIGGQLPIKRLRLSSQARVRAFRATVAVGDELAAKIDIVFLQRGRSVTILRFVFLNSPDDIEQGVTKALARRMR